MMKKLQFNLTVEEGKNLISRSVVSHPAFKKALVQGKILFKGGTTVSKISEIIIDEPLRISGRITTRGTTGGQGLSQAPHTVLLENKQWTNIDGQLLEISRKLGPQDLVICGANALDCEGHAALMAGSPGGGNVGSAISAWYTEGVRCLVTAGIEKLIPGNLQKIANKTGRKQVDLAWGMAVGLILLPGKVINEIEAVKILADVDCYSLGAGGLGQAQGGVVLEVVGTDKEIKVVREIVEDVKDDENTVSGAPQSLKECYRGVPGCSRHLACGYREGVLAEDENNAKD